MSSNLAQVLKKKKTFLKSGKLSTLEKTKLEKLYTSGPAAYGSARTLQIASKLSKTKVDSFLQ